MEEKVRFVLEYEQDNGTMTELCEVYGIARETGYVAAHRVIETSPLKPNDGLNGPPVTASRGPVGSFDSRIDAQGAFVLMCV
jgi:hypothetical protein